MRALPAVEIRNAQRRVRLPTIGWDVFVERALPLVIRTVAPRKSCLREVEKVSVLLVSDRRIATLHLRFMNIAGPTDVITFHHGEIFISVETAGQNALRFRTSVEDEIKLYVVHGLLHLHGFDDVTPAEARVMQAIQTRILRAAQTPKDVPKRRRAGLN